MSKEGAYAGVQTTAHTPLRQVLPVCLKPPETPRGRVG